MHLITALKYLQFITVWPLPILLDTNAAQNFAVKYCAFYSITFAQDLKIAFKNKNIMQDDALLCCRA